MGRKSFAGSVPITSSHLEADTQLPARTHITGILKTFKPAVWRERIHAVTGGPVITQPRVELNLECIIENDANILSDYTAQTSATSVPVTINVALWVRGLRPGEEYGDDIQDMLKDSTEALKESLLRQVTIDASGLMVSKVTSGAEVVVDLRGENERVYKVRGRDAIKLLRDPVPPSATPQWLGTPTSEIASPADPSSTPAQPLAPAVPGMKPLSSHLPQIVLGSSVRPKASQADLKGSKFPHPTYNNDSTPTVPAKRARSEQNLDPRASVHGSKSPDKKLSTEPSPSSSSKRARLEPSEATLAGNGSQSPDLPSQSSHNETITTRLAPRSSASTIRGTLSAPTLAETAFKAAPMQELPSNSAASQYSARSGSSGATRQESVAKQDTISKQRREAEDRARKAAQQKRAEKEKAEQTDAEALDALKQPFSTNFHTYDVIETLHAHTKANVMGVVVEVVPAWQTDRDACMTVIIADPTSHTEERTSEDFAVTMFRSNIEDLPRKVSPGTPMLFRGLSISYHKDKLKGQAWGNDHSNTWATLSGGKSLKIAKVGNMNPAIIDLETDRLKALHKWWSAVEGPSGETGFVDPPKDSPTKKDAWTLGQVHANLYFDGIFKIVHVVTNERGGKKPAFELYVTDGTVNSLPTRNFHSVQNPDDQSDELFKKGNTIKVRNIRVKLFKGELELAWANLQVRDTQEKWRNKKSTLLDKNDHRVQVINTRINQLKAGKIPPPAPRIEPQPETAVVAAMVNSDFATHLGTTFKDEIDYPISSLAEVKANKLIPNRFRVRARVSSLIQRNISNNVKYVQKQCKRCNRGFNGPFCLSCNDERLTSATIVYRFIAVLEQDGVSLPLIIADDEADKFLPRPPPLPRNQESDDLRKLTDELKKLSAQVERILLGPNHEGQRTRPIIDWTLETIEVEAPGKDKCLVVNRVFGMELRSNQ